MFYNYIYFVLTIYMSLELDLTSDTNLSLDIQDAEESDSDEPESLSLPSSDSVSGSQSSNNSDRYLLCIISCEKNRERKKILKDKWINDLIAKNEKIDTLFIYGNSELDEDYAEVEDELHVKCDDSYERLIDKMDKLWDYVHKCRNDYFKIIKCDDDNFIFTEKFNSMLDDIKDLPIFGKSCIDENFKNINSESLERDVWNGPFKIGWLYILTPEVIKEFIKNRDSRQYSGQHEDKRFYDMIRENYPFSEDKDLEDKYNFYGYPIIKNRHRRCMKKTMNKIHSDILKSIIISNLNTLQLENYKF
jgi:hypothetical protein